MKKQIVSLAIACSAGAILSSGLIQTASADDTTVAPTIHQNSKPETRTLIVAANGKLDGQIVPYVTGLPFTGDITLHYEAQNVGFVDGDIAVLTVALPDEFKYVASAPGFNAHVKGNVHTQTILGDKETPISVDMVETYSDRVIIKIPKEFWIGVGHVRADITINYGEFLSQYPQLPIPTAPGGYKFMAQLKYDSAMWDVIKDPILGTDDETYITDETNAIAP